ncbi:MAG TPA: hypothetical protein VEK38_03440 [Candidatus Bathyarchaeia archaeon]|nr:hypothetical protein [Candidatus Bathyarchaeia archaeon]
MKQNGTYIFIFSIFISSHFLHSQQQQANLHLFYGIQTRDKYCILTKNEIDLLKKDCPFINDYITESVLPPENPLELDITEEQLKTYLTFISSIYRRAFNPNYYYTTTPSTLFPLIETATFMESRICFPIITRILIEQLGDTFYSRARHWIHDTDLRHYLDKYHPFGKFLKKIVLKKLPFAFMTTCFNVQDIYKNQSKNLNIIAVNHECGQHLNNKQFLTFLATEKAMTASGKNICKGETVQVYDYTELLHEKPSPKCLIADMSVSIPASFSPTCDGLPQTTFFDYTYKQNMQPTRSLDTKIRPQELLTLSVIAKQWPQEDLFAQKQYKKYSVTCNILSGAHTNHSFAPYVPSASTERSMMHPFLPAPETALSGTFDVLKKKYIISTPNGTRTLSGDGLTPLNFIFSKNKHYTTEVPLFAALTEQNLIIWTIEQETPLIQIPLPPAVQELFSDPLLLPQYMTNSSDARPAHPPFYELMFDIFERNIIGIFHNYVVIWKLYDGPLETYIRNMYAK